MTMVIPNINIKGETRCGALQATPQWTVGDKSECAKARFAHQMELREEGRTA